MIRKTLKYQAILFFLLSFLFISSNIASTFIPQRLIRENALASAHAILNPKFKLPLSGSSFTDGIMLNITATQGNSNPIVDGLRGDMHLLGGYSPELAPEATIRHLQATGETLSTHSYGRYWHGYLLYMKVLLLFTDTNGIQYIGGFIFFSLLIWLTLLTGRHFGKKIGLYFLASQLIFMTTSAIVGLTNITCFLIAFLGSIIILLMSKKPNFCLPHVFSLFFVIGAVTCYFDFLRTPAITIGFPLLYFLLIHGKGKKISEIMYLIILCSVSWLIGYASFWILKWTIMLFVAPEQNEVTRGAILYRLWNSSVLEGKYFVRSFCVIVSTCLYCIAAAIFFFISRKFTPQSWGYLSGIVIVIGIPFIWGGLLLNHTVIHASFTYRMYSIALFGSLVLINEIWNQKNKKTLPLK